MNFKEYIELHRAEVYGQIDKYLPLKDPKEHYRIARDYSERMGSYRRPGLLMLSGQMFGAKIEDLLLPGAAMQLSEDWILIHDDVEDDSEMRRGKPALQKLYGGAIAINAGDAVHMEMWKIIHDFSIRMGPKIGPRLFEKFYDMLQFTVEGQFYDINFIYNIRSLAKADEEMYLRIIRSKTCYYTVYGPMQLGAIAAGQPDSVLNALREIGDPAGIAFQLTDDVLDMVADEKLFGKKRYGDLYEGKLTLIMLHAYKHSTKKEKEEIDRIYGKSREQKTKEEIDFLISIVEKYKSLDYVKKETERYGKLAEKAVANHSSMLPDNEYKKIMLSAVGELYLRKR